MQFFAMLSIVFYLKVVLLYLIPGHSHNAADRVVAWCRNKMRGRNYYTPADIVSDVNDINRVGATFVDHRDSRRPCFIGWSALLKKYFKQLPAGYTSNYFFEIDEGHVTMRHLCSTAESAAVATAHRFLGCNKRGEYSDAQAPAQRCA